MKFNSYIYNTNNNIKLARSKFKWVWLQRLIALGMAATPSPITLGVAVTVDLRVLDVSLTVRSCHESMITK
jgi:hypothetical protein